MNIITVQSIIRRWHCTRRYKSAQFIACKFQSIYRGMIVRDQLEFQHYCAGRVQSAWRGYIGTSCVFFLYIHELLMMKLNVCSFAFISNSFHLLLSFFLLFT